MVRDEGAALPSVRNTHVLVGEVRAKFGAYWLLLLSAPRFVGQNRAGGCNAGRCPP